MKIFPRPHRISRVKIRTTKNHRAAEQFGVAQWFLLREQNYFVSAGALAMTSVPL